MLALGSNAPSSSQDEQVLVDALPYLDTEYNEADRQMALRLIEQESKVFRPTTNYLKHLPIPDYDAFLTPTLLKEHARMALKQEMPKLDMSRTELPIPTGAGRSSVSEWKKAVDNAKAQNEHLAVRQLNLDMMDEYAAESHLSRNKELEKELTEAEKELRRMKEEVMEVHAHRKMSQMAAGRELKRLEGEWVNMITVNYRMELANNQLEESNARACKRLRLNEKFFE